MPEDKTAEDIAGEAYQVIGDMATAGDGKLWDHPEVQRALTYFSRGWREPGSTVLPFDAEKPVPPQSPLPTG